MQRLILILVFGATVAVLLGIGFYGSLRSGTLSNMYGTSRRAHEPFQYWIGMFAVAFACIVLTVTVIAMLVMVFMSPR